MTENDDTHQQQRSRDQEALASRDRSGLFGRLKRPQTLRLSFRAGLWLYRILRFGLRVLEFFE